MSAKVSMAAYITSSFSKRVKTRRKPFSRRNRRSTSLRACISVCRTPTDRGDFPSAERRAYSSIAEPDRAFRFLPTLCPSPSRRLPRARGPGPTTTRGRTERPPHFRARAKTSRPFAPLRRPDESWWCIPHASGRWLADRFFQCAGSVRMHLDAGAVQRKNLQADRHDLPLLESAKDALQYTLFLPAPQPCVDGVPFAERCWQGPPFAAVFHYVQHRIEQLQIGNHHVAALHRQ